MRNPPGRRSTSILAPAFLFLTCLGIGPAAHASPPRSMSLTAQSGEGAISVFRDRNTSVVVSGGTATAINECLTDASDGVIQNQQTACRQVASAGNFVDVTSITVYESKNVTITVSGGTATAINECVNDASDGVIQNQQNACNQAASAGNLVAVGRITISASKNATIDVNGGTATAGNACVNNASGGASQTQQNACIQVSDSENIVDIGHINVLTSKNITINVTGGIAVALFNCVNKASNKATATQQDTCTQVAYAGTSSRVGHILFHNSKNVTVTLDGIVVATVPTIDAKMPAALIRGWSVAH
jgi:hypothetical protein